MRPGFSRRGGEGAALVTGGTGDAPMGRIGAAVEGPTLAGASAAGFTPGGSGAATKAQAPTQLLLCAKVALAGTASRKAVSAARMMSRMWFSFLYRAEHKRYATPPPLRGRKNAETFSHWNQ